MLAMAILAGTVIAIGIVVIHVGNRRGLSVRGLNEGVYWRQATTSLLRIAVRRAHRCPPDKWNSQAKQQDQGEPTHRHGLHCAHYANSRLLLLLRCRMVDMGRADLLAPTLPAVVSRRAYRALLDCVARLLA